MTQANFLPILIPLFLGVAPMVSSHGAEALEQVLEAAQRLDLAPNYSWISTSLSAPDSYTWRQGPTEGQTEKDGSSFITVTIGDNSIMMSFHGHKAAINLRDEWLGAEELTDQRAWIADRLKTYKLPAAEARFLAEHADLQAANGQIHGALDEDALKFLLSRGRRQYDSVPGMQGTVRFSIQDGQLTQYQFHVRGKIDMGGDIGEVMLDRTATVAIQHVGATKVTVPEEAKAKLR